MGSKRFFPNSGTPLQVLLLGRGKYGPVKLISCKTGKTVYNYDDQIFVWVQGDARVCIGSAEGKIGGRYSEALEVHEGGEFPYRVYVHR